MIKVRVVKKITEKRDVVYFEHYIELSTTGLQKAARLLYAKTKAEPSMLIVFRKSVEHAENLIKSIPLKLCFRHMNIRWGTQWVEVKDIFKKCKVVPSLGEGKWMLANDNGIIISQKGTAYHGSDKGDDSG